MGQSLDRPTQNSVRVRGFTLVEIMAVVLIIALLGTLVGTAVVSQIDKARVTTAKTQIKQLEAFWIHGKNESANDANTAAKTTSSLNIAAAVLLILCLCDDRDFRGDESLDW